MSIYRKIRKVIRSKLNIGKQFSKNYGVVSKLPSNSVERRLLLSESYTVNGLYGVISLIEEKASSIPKFEKAKLYLEVCMSIRSIPHRERDVLLMAHLALDLDQSESIRRGYAWVALRHHDYKAAYEQVLVLQEIYKTNPNAEAEKSTEKIRLAAFKKLSKLDILAVSKSDNRLKLIKKNNYENIKGLTFPSLKEKEHLLEFLAKIYTNNNYFGLVTAIHSANGVDEKVKAYLFLNAAKLILKEGDHKLNIALTHEAIKLDQSEAILRGAYWAYKHGGDRVACKNCLDRIRVLLEEKPSLKIQANYDKLKRNYDDTYSGLDIIEEIPESAQDLDYKSIKGRVAYVLHNSFPYSSGGYATRGHGLAKALKDLGVDIQVVNRPGFPFDLKEDLDSRSTPKLEIVDDIEYIKIPTPWRKGKSASDYIREASKALIVEFQELKPAIVVAASNFITAMPALIAARTLGIPFIYEVRGFWEITRLSREPSYEFHPNFTVQKTLEAAVATRANHVFTLTTPMKAELIDRGVPAKNITLLPNSCDPLKFIPRERDVDLARKLNIPKTVPVIGYIGTFVIYEGLEYLAQACGLLKEKGIEFRLLIVGNENASGLEQGPITQQILETVQKYKFSEWLLLPGRVPFEEVEAYYSLVDIAPFPRKPWPVCEMVSPMKPLEALAMEKAVVVSSVKALVEMVEHKHTGLVFEKGNVESLAQAIELLITDVSLRHELGKNGRLWVETERTWDKTAAIANLKINQLLG